MSYKEKISNNDKTLKRVWKFILNTDLEVDISETDYHPSGFHHHKN